MNKELPAALNRIQRGCLNLDLATLKRRFDLYYNELVDVFGSTHATVFVGVEDVDGVFHPFSANQNIPMEYVQKQDIAGDGTLHGMITLNLTGNAVRTMSWDEATNTYVFEMTFGGKGFTVAIDPMQVLTLQDGDAADPNETAVTVTHFMELRNRCNWSESGQFMGFLDPVKERARLEKIGAAESVESGKLDTANLPDNVAVFPGNKSIN